MSNDEIGEKFNCETLTHFSYENRMFLKRKEGLIEVKGGRSDEALEVLHDNEMPKLRNQKFRGDPDDEP